jgi:hypothetical protein
MKDKNIWIELVKKIELQSIIVLFAMIFAGVGLFIFKDPFPSPTSILGICLIGFGIVYSFASFFTNNLRESYKDIIAEYKSLNIELSKNYKAISDNYLNQISTIQGASTHNTPGITDTKYKQQIDEGTKIAGE